MRGKKEIRFIIMAILIVLVAILVLYPILTYDSGFHPSQAIIAVTCKKGTQNGDYHCNIANADPSVNFPKITIWITDLNGTIVSLWNAPITFNNGIRENESAKNPVLIGRVIDNSDGRLGINDEIYLCPIKGENLIGLTVRLSGGGDGIATIQ